MCLVRNDSVKITGNRVWKILWVNLNGVSSIFYPHMWKPGWHLCHYYDLNAGTFVHNGFHTYLNKEDAENTLNKIKSFYSISSKCLSTVEFTFDLKDLVATGLGQFDHTKQAVFKRLHLSQEEYDGILLRRQRQ